MEDLSSPELVGGEDSLLASDEVMVIPGHVADASRPSLLAVTRGWSGKEPQSFAKVVRQVKARLTESNGRIQVVIVFCDCWDSASFQEEHREELRNGRALTSRFPLGVGSARVSRPRRVLDRRSPGGASGRRPAVRPVARSGDLATTWSLSARIPGSYFWRVPERT